MGLRIGVGFRPFRHVWIGASVPLFGHARRIASHRGHGEHAGLISMLLGLLTMYVVLRVCWAILAASARGAF
jgi:hypothetical protein